MPVNRWEWCLDEWEWCLDKWHYNYEGAPSDGRAWVDGTEGEESNKEEEIRVLRGGSWRFSPKECRSACRFNAHPDYSDYNFGFHVCCLPTALNP